MTTTYRVTSAKAEEIHTGATFAPGDTAVGFDPADAEDARKLDEGLFAEVREPELDVTEEAEELAREQGLDLGKVAGSGQNGRITKGDVEKAVKDREEKS
jgi:pyruvate/2-oxoglutarate dehydrogenase complex dihydrolipoamide acyltransferase (E2) component